MNFVHGRRKFLYYVVFTEEAFGNLGFLFYDVCARTLLGRGKGLAFYRIIIIKALLLKPWQMIMGMSLLYGNIHHVKGNGQAVWSALLGFAGLVNLIGIVKRQEYRIFI